MRAGTVPSGVPVRFPRACSCYSVLWRTREGVGWRGAASRPELERGSAPGRCQPDRRRIGHLWRGGPSAGGPGCPEGVVTSRRAGLAIALAAIVVQAPRLVLALLAADRLPVAPATERGLLLLAGIGTALVLTGGNLYLAHTVAQVEPWRRTLAATWLAVLAASGGLVLPLIVAGLSARSLPEILGAGGLAWPWGVLVAIAHELTAAGCVLASAAWASQAGTAGGGAAAPARAGAGGLPAGSDARMAAGVAAAAALPQAAAQRIACRAGCGKSFVSQQAEIAHLRHCPRRRARAGAEPAN
jgi:hypothetical protein